MSVKNNFFVYTCSSFLFRSVKANIPKTTSINLQDCHITPSFYFLPLSSSFTLPQPNWPACVFLQALGMFSPPYFAFVFFSLYEILTISEIYLANTFIAFKLLFKIPLLNKVYLTTLFNITIWPQYSSSLFFFFAIFSPLPHRILYTLHMILFIMYHLSRFLRKEQGSSFYSLMYQEH